MRALIKSITAAFVTSALLAAVALADPPARTIPADRRGGFEGTSARKVSVGSVSAARISPPSQTRSTPSATPSVRSHASGGVTARRVVSAPPAPAVRPVTSNVQQRSKSTPVVVGVRRPLDRKPVTPVFTPVKRPFNNGTSTPSGGAVVINHTVTTTPVTITPCAPPPVAAPHHPPVPHHPPAPYCPPVVRPVVFRPHWSFGSGWSIGYQGKKWSISLSDWCWPVNRTVRTVYIERPVVEREIIYQPAPAVRVVDAYSEMDNLIDTLKYGSADQRKAAAKELGYQDSPRALYPLIYALEYDQDSTVRYLAAKALGRLGYRDALPALRKAADSDTDEVVRSESQDSIDMILNARTI